MFERFTDQARRVVVLARQESELLRHQHIGTEHLLLGLIAEREGVAARALASLKITLDAARDQVKEIIAPGQEPPAGHIPFTPRAKKILELSLREALKLGSGVIGTEHVLISLMEDADGVGAQVVVRLGATPAAVRKAVLLADPDPEAAEARHQPTARAMARDLQLRADTLIEVKDLLVSMDRRLSAIERHLGIPAGQEDAGQEEPPAAAGE